MSSLIERSKRAGLLVADAAEKSRSEEEAAAVRRVLESLQSTLKAATEVREFEEATGILPSSPVKADEVRKRAMRLRTEIRNQGLGALQGKAAESVQDACAKHVKNLGTGVKREWVALFADLDSINRRAATLPSSVRRGVQTEIQLLRALSHLHPIGDAFDISAKLGADRSSHRAVVEGRVHALGVKVEAAIEAHANETSPALKALLKQASTPDGFNLEDLTDELLSELRTSGHLVELVLHRV